MKWSYYFWHPWTCDDFSKTKVPMINLRFAPMDCFHPTLTLMAPKTHGRCLSNQQCQAPWHHIARPSYTGEPLVHIPKLGAVEMCLIGTCAIVLTKQSKPPHVVLENSWALPSNWKKTNQWIPTWQHFFVTLFLRMDFKDLQSKRNYNHGNRITAWLEFAIR